MAWMVPKRKRRSVATSISWTTRRRKQKFDGMDGAKEEEEKCRNIDIMDNAQEEAKVRWHGWCQRGRGEVSQHRYHGQRAGGSKSSMAWMVPKRKRRSVATSISWTTR